VKKLAHGMQKVGHYIYSSRPTSCSTQNIEAVRESVAEGPGTSIWHRGQELDISRSSLQRILTKDLHLHAVGRCFQIIKLFY
jgi:hypothetical protein